ncbi:hypothetical protein DX887_23225 [Vibrio alginolyticus]|uniref:hypothetical protein n=1 Tax=Vibrio alginolyticus TaxID=663 RepID=UPI001980202B|nr:hypothetical protein [Vibrio alginolyticus]EGR2558707.1 hypothetical protein [Vibrio alginolyticus]EHC9866293.1 hypothetical protein [Vibrio alginolyticus]EJS0322125.1 hypothetical protein [Vibrio alginolyticus]EJV5743999.1 hypothetical protein [Vibrio alginolyticus]ELA7834367.1 hypothetical protein [Vibrio alginolyticus]
MDAFESGLACYCHQSQNEVNRIRRFSQSIDSHWESKAKRLDSEFEKSLAETTCEDKRQELGETYGMFYYEDIVKSEWIHKHSVVITISSFVENSLYELCELLALHQGQPLKLHEKGRLSKVEKCLLYLEDNAHLNLAECKEEADAMIVAYKLRNQIIHNNGKMTERFEKQKAQWKGLVKGSLGAYIEIDSKFITWYLEQVAAFYYKLAPEVSSFIQRTKIA